MNGDYKIMIQLKHIKAACICLALCCVCGMTTGCKQKPDENGSLKAEDGRSYGGTIKGNQGEKVQTAFFDMTVDPVTKNNTFQFEDGLYQADEGKTYLVVTLTIKNNYEKDIPMSITFRDFPHHCHWKLNSMPCIISKAWRM